MDNNEKKLNKKGAALTAWIEAVVIIVFFIVALGIIGSKMNEDYSGISTSHDLTYGLNSNATQNALIALEEDFSNSTTEGQMSFSTFGWFIISTVPHMLYSTVSLLITFVSGGFINSIVGMLQIGEFTNIVTIVLRLLWVLGLIFVLIKLVLKVPST
jgi:hypothetical protein